MTHSNPTPNGGVNRTHGHSTLQKTTFALLHALSVGFLAYLVFFDGLTTLVSLLNEQWTVKNEDRLILIFACAALYFVRHLVTLLYLLVRKVDWGEVVGLSIFIGLFEIGFAVLASGIFSNHPTPLSWIDGVWIILLLGGSYLNTGSELQRKWWKRRPENQGHCYTGGLFRYAMHINYFGDVVLFTGWALLTGAWVALILPAFMAVSFIGFHIPGLDAYLSNRYGEAFDRYASNTKKLIPWVY
ncbi:DUF1295 domain-containing protein [Reinekea blandensis]|uniref:DUF1295 domain-containing protein n=1 Tax=Reinekea blandensis TaxID=374838 RepID=UPI0002FFFC1E|nr:DUF1295 domain-containing protein [Reinekea blandensis]